MAKRKLTTSVDEVTHKELRRLKREGLNASDVLAIAVEIARENPELFYAVAWKLKHTAGEAMTTFDELATTVKLASELQTDAVEAEIIRVRVDKDRYGRTVLKIWFKPDGESDVYITSLPPALVRELAAKAKYYGFKTPDELVGTRWLFKRVSITDYVNNAQFQGYDRVMPIQLICDSQWLEKRINGASQLTESDVAELRRMCHGDAVMEYLKEHFVARREKGTVVYYRK